MEGTNALIDTLVQTKSLERVLSPISSKLSQLIIQNEAFERGDVEAFPQDLTPSAMDVMKSSEKLVEAGRNLCSTSADHKRYFAGDNTEIKHSMIEIVIEDSDKWPRWMSLDYPFTALLFMYTDMMSWLCEVHRRIHKHVNNSPEKIQMDLKRQMPDACESLSVAGQIMVSATQRLELEDFSQEARVHLIQSAKTLLEATLKVLLVSDDAELRRVTKTGQVVLQRLAVLTTVQNMKQLVPVFKSVTESVMLFANMADKRQLDLTSRVQRDAVMAAVTLLRRSIPLLSSAMQTFVKFPENAQALSSKEYALGQMVECVNDVISAVGNKQNLRTLEEVEEPGHFVTTIDQIMSRLCVQESGVYDAQLLGGGFDQLVDEAVRHSMTVAHLSEEEQRNTIIQTCHQVLKERSQLCELLKSVEMDSELTEAPRELEQTCDKLHSTVQDLERSVNEAVLHLVIDTFRESSEPLERFVKAAMCLYKIGEEESADGERLLQTYIEAFHTHSDAICQVARFVAGGCSISHKVRGLRCCVNQLEKLDPEIVPSVLGCRLTNHAATEHLRMLKQEWLANIDLLLTNIDGAFHLRNFLEISEHKLRNTVEGCRNSMYLDLEELTESTRCLVGMARRIAIVSQKIVDRSDCVTERSTVMPYVHHLKKVVKATKSAASRLLGETGELRYHETFHARCDLLLRSVVKLRQTLMNNTRQDEKGDDTDNEELLRDLELFEKDSAKPGEEVMEEFEGGCFSSEVGTANGMTPIEERVQVAVKCYVADLKSDKISELSKSFVSGAVAGQKQRVDLLGNDLLKWTNHITEIADAMAICIQDIQKKRTLSEVSSLVRTEVSDLLSLSARVLDCQIEDNEQLYTVAEQWTNHMSYLLHYVDGMIEQWKSASDKVTDSAKLCNVKLVKAQMSHLHTHLKFILALVDSGRQFLQNQSGMCLDRSCLSQDECLELENLTSFLSTQADSVATSDSSSEKAAIDLTSREWGAKAFCILTSFVTTAYKSIAMRKKISEVDCDNVTSVRMFIGQYREETVHIKALVNQLCESGKALDNLHQHLQCLDSVLRSMDESADLLGVVVSPDKVIEKFYAPYELIRLQWAWVLQVEKICQLMDKVTGDFGVLSQQITSTASKGAVKLLIERFKDVRKYTDHSIQACSGPDRLQIQQMLRDLETVGGDLHRQTETEENRDPLKLTILKRVWAVKCEKLLKTLKSLNTVNQSTVRDVEKLCCTCPEPVRHRQEDLLRQQQRAETEVGQTTHTKVAQQAKTTATRSTQLQHFKEKQQNSLSSSLLDYATVLGTTLVEFDNSALDSSPIHSPSDTLSLTTRQDRGLAHCYTPPVTQKTPVDASWQELARGPRAQHSTPVRPTPQSGYKPTRNSHTQGYQLSSEIERWEDENNAIVRVAKETTHLVENMSLYLKGTGILQSREELIDTAREVASNGEKLVKFAKILVEYSTDKSRAGDLQSYCQTLPTVIAQLHIMSRVKQAASDEDGSSELMLLKTAQNLLKAVTAMLNCAEAVCVKGLRQPPADALDETEAVILAIQWKRRFTEHRQQQNCVAARDALGLRRVAQSNGVPALTQIMQ